MKLGSIVMFVKDGMYAKHFFGQLAKVVNYVPQGHDGRPYCKVQWLSPVKYHDKYTTVSSFSTDHFELIA